MRISVRTDDGADLAFDCEDTWVSRWVCTDILRGRTYPWLPFVPDVQVIVDAGANCGAATVYFAHRCPGARVHAFEPGSRQRAILDRNAADHPNVSVHPFGLFSEDQWAILTPGPGDAGQSTVLPTDRSDRDGERVGLRSAGGWAAEEGIDRIDVLKVDVEGCEVDVLQSLASLLPTVKVLYVEYDTRAARRAIDELLRPTHELFSGKVLLDQGELIYLRTDLAATAAATEHIRELLRTGLADAGS